MFIGKRINAFWAKKIIFFDRFFKQLYLIGINGNRSMIGG